MPRKKRNKKKKVTSRPLQEEKTEHKNGSVVEKENFTKTIGNKNKEVNKPSIKNGQKPSDIWMISACEDGKTSADVYYSGKELPDSLGRSGGACTAALLKVLYDNSEEKPKSFIDVLKAIRCNLKKSGFTQVPQLTSSTKIDYLNEPFELVPSEIKGTRRAVIIGINYVGQKGALLGCHNDALNIKKYITEVHGLQDPDITVLMDDDNADHASPTKENILAAYKDVVSKSKKGDVIFLHFSGHGTQIKDDNGDEEDGYDECLCPLDFNETGVISDDQLHDILVKPLTEGVRMVALMDCCHSGTALDLPYTWKEEESKQEEMQLISECQNNTTAQLDAQIQLISPNDKTDDSSNLIESTTFELIAEESKPSQKPLHIPSTTHGTKKACIYLQNRPRDINQLKDLFRKGQRLYAKARNSKMDSEFESESSPMVKKIQNYDGHRDDDDNGNVGSIQSFFQLLSPGSNTVFF